MLYREMQSKGDVVKAKAKKARPVIKPGAKKVRTNNDVARQKKTQLRKSGSINDALALMIND
jgi:hypothetical protein